MATTPRKETEMDELLTLKELAERLRMHPRTVRILWRKRLIPGIRIGKRMLRFDFQHVVEELQRRSDCTP